MRCLVTGSAGFVGFHLTHRLLEQEQSVVGYDALTPCYDVRLKHARHVVLERHDRFTPVVARLEYTEALRRAAEYGAAKMIEAAQALENSDDDRNNRISSTFCEFVGSDHHELELRRSTEAAIILMTSSTEAH